MLAPRLAGGASATSLRLRIALTFVLVWLAATNKLDEVVTVGASAADATAVVVWMHGLGDTPNGTPTTIHCHRPRIEP